jgi:hypothetical protein
MIDAARLHAFRNALVVGTGRSETKNALADLALVATLVKFEPRPAPESAPAPRLHLRPETYPNAAARRTLLRLLSGRDGNVADNMAAAIPVVLKEHALALHPFDFAKLEDFIEKHADRLTAMPRDWLRAIRPEKKDTDDPYLDGPVTEEHLAQASKSQRITFLRELRARDPSRARALVEASLPHEAADMRLRLLKILEDGISPGDQPFLEGLQNDRAQTVKDHAQALLARIPGADAFVRRIARLKDDLQIKTEGLIRRRKVFVYKGPDAKPGQNRFAALLSGLSFTDIAKAYGESPETLIAAALQTDKMADLLIVLVRSAVDARQFDIVRAACDQLSGSDGQLAFALIDDEFAGRPDADRREILQLCFDARQWKQLPHPAIVSHIAARIPPALPQALAESLLGHTDWAKIEETARKPLYDAIAHLIPASLSPAFSGMADAYAPRAALYHRFLQSLSS